MKTTQFISAALFSAAVIFTSCNPESKVEQANQDVEKAENDLEKAKTDAEVANNEWMTYREQQEQKIKENEASIAAYREMEKDAKYKAKYREKINELEEKNNELRTRIGEDHKNDNKEQWESFKREFSHDMDELGRSLKNIGNDNVK